MIDKFDYAEPSCPISGGKDFYYPQKDAPLGHIPVDRIISKVDSFFDKNDYQGAGRLLLYWKNEAISLKDKRGELAMESELIGFYRKQNEREKALSSVSRALFLVNELEQENLSSGATVFINCATAYKAFDMPKEALPLYKRAEKVYREILSKTDRRFGGLYNNMALALADLEMYDEAEEAYFSALGVMQNIPGGEPESAITQINLAHLYEKMGKNEKITECLENALSLLKKENLSHDGYYAFVLEKCAPSFEYFGNEKIANELKKESGKIYAGA